MGLPETVRVKVSTEAAEYIAMTAVVAREMPVRELVELMLGLTGKDAVRVHELLFRGTLVSGASRLRWAGWDADRAELEALLATFPDADPGRPFARERCVMALLRGPSCRIEITRQAGSGRRLLRRRSFWDAVMEETGSGVPRYLDYSYKDRADRYVLELSAEAASRLRESAAAIRYTSLEAQVKRGAFDTLELHVARQA